MSVPRPDPAAFEQREPLPGVLAEIERVAGYAAALRVAEAAGGRRMQFCSIRHLRKNGGTWLSEAVGLEAAIKITSTLFGSVTGSLDIPLAGASAHVAAYRNRRRLALAMYRDGMSTREVALKLKITERGARQIRRGLRLAGELP